MPPKTPDGEDSPKWQQTVAARMEEEEVVRQIEFACPKPPGSASKSGKSPVGSSSIKRACTPSSYASSSFSPRDDPEAAAFFGAKRTRIMYGQNPANYTPGGKPK